MSLSHRTRLTLASSGSAGVVFLVLFAISSIGLSRAEEEEAQGELAPAVNQVLGDMAAGDRRPDLAEIVQSNPDVSLAVFKADGQLVAREGKFDLRLAMTNGIQDQMVIRTAKMGGETVVAALPWARHEARVMRFQMLSAVLWLPLVGVVALATWLAARSTFLPLERLAKEAEELSDHGPGSRLHAEDSGEYAEFVLRLNRFLDRLGNSVRREERFLSDAAHELRTPLTVLRGEIETSLRKDRSKEEYQATLGVLLDETSRLASLVELLLRSATVTQSENSVSDIREVAERAHARWVDRFSSKGVRLVLEAVSAGVRLSEAEFDVVLDNLLANSLSASNGGTTCTISTGNHDAEVWLSVSDQGPGISEEDAVRIFERFARVDTGRARSDGGFGIGLALCKRIIEGRGGTIRVEPADPKGSRFTVELPTARLRTL